MKKITLLLLIVAVFLATFRLWMPEIGKFLILEDSLQKADGIVVLRGDDFYPFQKAVELYQDGYAGYILLSSLPIHEETLKDYYDFRNKFQLSEGVTGQEMTLRAFEHLGKNSQDIYFTGKETDSTFDEAVAAKDWMRVHNHQSLILVGNIYHMRRAVLIFKKVFKGTGVKIYHVTAENLLYKPQEWWRSERDVRRVFEEYLSIVFNFIYRFLLQKNNSSFDTFQAATPAASV